MEAAPPELVLAVRVGETGVHVPFLFTRTGMTLLVIWNEPSGNAVVVEVWLVIESTVTACPVSTACWEAACSGVDGGNGGASSAWAAPTLAVSAPVNTRPAAIILELGRVWRRDELRIVALSDADGKCARGRDWSAHGTQRRRTVYEDG